MELYEVLDKRRTYRDYSDREVSDEILKRVIRSEEHTSELQSRE